MNKRTIELTHEEIELIKTALDLAHRNISDVIAKNRSALTEGAREELINNANKYLDVQDVFDGTRDV